MIKYNVAIPLDGLTHLFDARNKKSLSRSNSNLTNWNDWTVGTGGTATYSVNGDGNSRVIDTNPWGHQEVVWDVSNQDVASDADGGFSTAYRTCDRTKLHRMSTFVRRKVVGNGSFYLGMYCTPGSVFNRINGASNGNPYFYSGGWTSPAEDWYLVVGHVFPEGSGVGANHPDSGIYTMAGVRASSIQNDFVLPAATGILLRSYLFYSTDTTTNQQWYQPRIDVCDGTEPTVAQLIANAENTWKNPIGSQDVVMRSYPTKATDSLVFNGTDQCCTFDTSIMLGDGTKPWTVNAWMKTTTTVSGNGEGAILSNASAGTASSALCVSSGKTCYLVWQGGAWVKKLGSAIVNDGKFHLLTWVQYHTGNMDMYVDGVFDATVADSSMTSQNPVDTIGGSWSAKFAGEISALTIHNRSLSSTEVQSMYYGMKGR